MREIGFKLGGDMKNSLSMHRKSRNLYIKKIAPDFPRDG